jgi:uncharacterized LabA/DUF88 family protein
MIAMFQKGTISFVPNSMYLSTLMLEKNLMQRASYMAVGDGKHEIFETNYGLEKNMLSDNNKKLALVIDAENAQASLVESMLAEISHFGTCSIRRAYGDWTTQHLRCWKEVLHINAIQPIQQFSYSKGKNSSDSAMIIDVMDLLHSEAVDGFCIASSDSDFTRLTVRIREAGLWTLGLGERKTPVAFSAACDKFVFTESLPPRKSHERSAAEPDVIDRRQLDQMLLEVFTVAHNKNEKSEWISLASFGNELLLRHPTFNWRSHGYSRLSEFISSESQSCFELRSFPRNSDPGFKNVYVRKNSGSCGLAGNQSKKSTEPDVFSRLGRLFATAQH